MDFLISIITDLIRPLGNLFVKKILPKGIAEEDSTISDFIGAILLIALLVLSGLLLNGTFTQNQVG